MMTLADDPLALMLASYGRLPEPRRATRAAGDPIPQFRYDPATDRVVQVGTTASVGDGSVRPTAYNGLGGVVPVLPVTTVAPSAVSEVFSNFWGVARAASVLASAYHGVRRNNGSIGWGVAWGLLGGVAPIITPAVALAQGFGQPARK